MSASIRPNSDTIRTGNTALFQPSTSVEDFTRTSREGYGVRAAIRGSTSVGGRIPNLEGSAVTSGMAPAVDVAGRSQPFRKPTISGNSPNLLPAFSGAAMSGLATYANNQANVSSEGFNVGDSMGRMGSFEKKETYTFKGSSSMERHQTLAEQRALIASKRENFGPMSGRAPVSGNLTLAEQRALIIESFSGDGSSMEVERFGHTTSLPTGNLTIAQLNASRKMEMFNRK